MYIGGGCALWFSIRLKMPTGTFWRKLSHEVIHTTILGIATVMVLPLLSGLFGLWAYEEISRFDRLDFLFLASSIPAYLALRLVNYGCFFWNRLRNQRILWGLVHTQLSVVVVVTVLIALLGAVVITVEANRNFQETSLAATIAHRIVLTIIPFMAVMTVSLLTTLVIILPPAALASYLFSKRMTQRLESLTETASALRQGDYAARVTVTGVDEFAQLQSDFNAMADDLEVTLENLESERDKVTALLNARRQLIASVSHELRTPLATLRGYLEPAIEQVEPPSPGDLAIIQRETQRLEELVDDLFTLSQAEVDHLNLQIQSTNINPIIQRLVDIYAPLAWGQGRVQVVTQTEGEVLSALVDGTRLEQIITNLLRNAIRHTPPGGIVAVVTLAADAWVQVEVRDTGDGIAPDDLPHIFERFYRGQANGKMQGGGAGLGLALVKELSEVMGGTVNVQSTLGEGSVFTVKLPQA
jgi:signal transduction histidine kinase